MDLGGFGYLDRQATGDPVSSFDQARQQAEPRPVRRGMTGNVDRQSNVGIPVEIGHREFENAAIDAPRMTQLLRDWDEDRRFEGTAFIADNAKQRFIIGDGPVATAHDRLVGKRDSLVAQSIKQRR